MAQYINIGVLLGQNKKFVSFPQPTDLLKMLRLERFLGDLATFFFYFGCRKS
jgi:hypothetical protein